MQRSACCAGFGAAADAGERSCAIVRIAFASSAYSAITVPEAAAGDAAPVVTSQTASSKHLCGHRAPPVCVVRQRRWRVRNVARRRCPRPAQHLCAACGAPPGDEDVKPSRVHLLDFDFIACKVPMFSFLRLSGADPKTGVEMQSTGEVACFGRDANEARRAATCVCVCGRAICHAALVELASPGAAAVNTSARFVDSALVEALTPPRGSTTEAICIRCDL